MGPHAVEFDSLVVINVQIFRLGHCEHRMVLQKANVTHFIFCLEFTHEVLALPVEQGEMALLTCEKEMLSVSSNV
jgi:hypothetical protein